MLPQASNSVLLHELQQNHTQRDEEQFYPMDVHIRFRQTSWNYDSIG